MNLTEHERIDLEAIVNDADRGSRKKTRARIVLMAGNGFSNQQISKALKISRDTTRLWLSRYRNEGCAGLIQELPRKPGRRPISDDRKMQVLQRTMTQPSDGALFWTDRAMAQTMGLSRVTIQNIWREHRVRPHGLRDWRKLIDIVGVFSDQTVYALIFTCQDRADKQIRKYGPLTAGWRDAEECQRDLKMLPHDIGKLVIHTHLRPEIPVKTDVHRGWLRPFHDFLTSVEEWIHRDLKLHAVVGSRHSIDATAYLTQLGEGQRWTVSFSPSIQSLTTVLSGLFTRAAKPIARGEILRSARQLQWRARYNLGRDDKPFVWKN